MSGGSRFVGGGLIPPHRRGTTWDGAIHAADWYSTRIAGSCDGLFDGMFDGVFDGMFDGRYSTFASLAGVSVDGTGPLAADGVDVSNGRLTGGPSPRNEVVLQVLSQTEKLVIVTY